MPKPLGENYLRDILSGTEYIHIAMDNNSTLDEQAMEGETTGAPNDNEGNGGEVVDPNPPCSRVPMSKGR